MKKYILTAVLATTSPIAIAQNSAPPTVDESIAPSVQDDMAGEPVKAGVPSEIETRIMDDALERALSSDVHASVIEGARRAYVQTMFEPIWTREGVEQLEGMTSELSEYGLTTDEVVQADLEALESHRFTKGSEATQAQADLALTEAWLKIAAAVGGGLADEGAADTSNKAAASYALLPEKLIEAGKGQPGQALQAFEPSVPEYSALKDTLQTYRTIREDGGWLAIPEGDVIETGDTDPRVPAIRERLAAEGYDASRSAFSIVSALVDAGWMETTSDTAESGQDTTEKLIDPNLYDEELSEAVKAFQTRHGVKIDGVFGPGTRSAMNESVDSKISRIEDSMKRWRRLSPISDRYIWVNIPSYRVEGWKDGERGIVTKAIMGQPNHETPTFSDKVEYAVANPRWYVPSSITREETAPKLAKDAGYAARNNLMVRDRETGETVSPMRVNWNSPDVAEKYRLIQQPGPGNALGQVKLIFPNNKAIYMHDTPADHLFDRDQRAFSHGCIRLEKPIEMARWIASMDSTTDADRLERTIEEGDDRTRFDFKTPVPVHITYMTVTVDEEGEASFWRDIYNRTDGISPVEEVANAQPEDLERG
ncbi:L,D-transpeptidase family protein [Henriciella sp.]|uniref:L,D-transpeptidase family protein n=1 Tax=Henriciella sp. TaxID=1968823 RepID=UPI002615C7E4|nr:L,D-transpeptidase family protein [Henriciella sp.]